MPRGDRTGPAGMGPMTGRAAGYCAGYPVPGYMNTYGGRMSQGGWNSYVGRGLPAFYGAQGYYPTYSMPLWGGRRFLGFGFGRGRGRGRRGW